MVNKNKIFEFIDILKIENYISHESLYCSEIQVYKNNNDFLSTIQQNKD